MDSTPGSKTPLVNKGGAPNRENIDRVKNQVDQVKEVMRDNIDRAIIRGGDLDDLDSRSQQLEADSRIFKSVVCCPISVGLSLCCVSFGWHVAVSFFYPTIAMLSHSAMQLQSLVHSLSPSLSLSS